MPASIVSMWYTLWELLRIWSMSICSVFLLWSNNYLVFVCRQWGFTSYLREMFTAPDPVMAFLCKQYGVHRVPVGSQRTMDIVDQVNYSNPKPIHKTTIIQPARHSFLFTVFCLLYLHFGWLYMANVEENFMRMLANWERVYYDNRGLNVINK